MDSYPHFIVFGAGFSTSRVEGPRGPVVIDYNGFHKDNI